MTSRLPDSRIGVVDNHRTIEEPDAMKVARPVLKGGGEKRFSFPT
jgi:hypothetical protein